MTMVSDGQTRSGLSIKLSNLQPRSGLRYDLGGEKREQKTNPPPNINVLGKEKKNLLLAFCKSADSAAIDEAFDLLIGHKLLKEPEQNHDNGLPRVAPQLWENRTTGRKVSPAEFIRTHYAPWLGLGLTRSHIGQLDQPLYWAYSQQVRRDASKAIPELPSEERVKLDDPAVALERARDKARDRKRRHNMSRNVQLT